MRHGRIGTTIIVPTYNEGGNVAELVRRLTAAFQGIEAEILFVDDSLDDTPAVIECVAGFDGVMPVRMIHREGVAREDGLAGAVVAGILASRSTNVIVMDGDLQHPPEVAPLLLLALEHADLAVASRYAGDGDSSGLSSSFRRAVSSGSTLLARSCFPRRVGRVCSDPMTGFFAFRRHSIEFGRLRPRGFKILLEILARHDLKVVEIPFVFADRSAGESKASWRNGLQFIYQMASLRMGRMSRFAAIGVIGAVVNLIVMASMLTANAHYIAAAVAGALVSIVGNFFLQERFVFRDLRDGAFGLRARLTRHTLFNGGEALVRLPFLALLVEQTNLFPVLAQGVLLVVAFFARFFFTARVVYRPAAVLDLAEVSLPVQSKDGGNLPATYVGE